MTTRGRPPNKRLKLPGPTFRGSVRSEEAYVCAPASSYRRAGRLRPPALAPQLKRDPLGASRATVDKQQLAGTVFWVILLLAAAAPFYLKDRGRRRNRAGRCARCAAHLPWDDRFRVEGLLLCPTCAQRTRSRVGVAAVVMVALGVLSSLFGIVAAVSLRSEEHTSELQSPM